MLTLPTGHPGHPPTSSPFAMLRWMAARNAGLLTVAVLLATLEALTGAAIPYMLGVAVDAGLENGLSSALIWGVAIIFAIGVLQALASASGHVTEVGAWLRGAFSNSRLVGQHVTRTGAALNDALPTGEVVATVASDSFHLGNLFEMFPRFVAGVIVYVTVGAVMLGQSVSLGVAILVGLPVLGIVLSLTVKPLHARQAVQREASGKLTTLGSDTVSGLRILRGIGGEDAFADRYRAQSQQVRRTGVAVAGISAVLEALQVLLPGLFVAGVVWFGALQALDGQISAGQLVTFYGFTAFLAQPLRAATQFLMLLTRARVALRKVIKVLTVEPHAGSIAESEEADAREVSVPHAESVELSDSASGLVVRPGVLTALVSGRPEETAALARRLGRFSDDDPPVHLDGVPLTELPLAQVRERVVVASATPELFTGTLREGLAIRDGHDGAPEGTGLAPRDDDAVLLRALEVSDAHDVLESLPEGLDGEITEKGRSLSGGQRQRVALARALLTEAAALVLVEPTSAVDAHTEARIAAKLADYRRGRTTVVVTASPLVLEHADEVVLVSEGRARVRGTHRELLDRAAAGELDALAYHAVVDRVTASNGGRADGHEAAGADGTTHPDTAHQNTALGATMTTATGPKEES